MAQGLCKRAILILAFGMNVGVSNWPLNGASLSATGEVPFAKPNAGAIPKWTNGVLITVDGWLSARPVIFLYDRSGVQTSAIPFSISGAARIYIADFDRGVDGTIGLVGSATEADGRTGSFVATISPDGSISKTTRTSPYSARHVAVAPDGTLWTEGWEMVSSAALKADGKTHHTAAESFVPGAGNIRHFDREGNLVVAFVAQSTFHIPEAIGGVDNFLRVSADRVVMYSGRDQKFVDALKLVDQLAEALPGGPALILLRAQLYAGMGRPTEAVAEFNRLLQRLDEMRSLGAQLSGMLDSAQVERLGGVIAEVLRVVDAAQE